MELPVASPHPERGVGAALDEARAQPRLLLHLLLKFSFSQPAAGADVVGFDDPRLEVNAVGEPRCQAVQDVELTLGGCVVDWDFDRFHDLYLHPFKCSLTEMLMYFSGRERSPKVIYKVYKGAESAFGTRFIPRLKLVGFLARFRAKIFLRVLFRSTECAAARSASPRACLSG